LISTSIAKPPKTIPAIADPEILASKGELDGSVVWTLPSVSEAPSLLTDYGDVSRLVMVSGRRSYRELSRYRTMRK